MQVEIRSKLGRGRAGIRCKKTQHVADITVSKSYKTPTAQKVTKYSMDFSVPKQLIKKQDRNNYQKRDTG